MHTSTCAKSHEHDSPKTRALGPDVVGGL